MKTLLGLILTTVGIGLLLLPIYLAVKVSIFWLLLYFFSQVFLVVLSAGLLLLGVDENNKI